MRFTSRYFIGEFVRHPFLRGYNLSTEMSGTIIVTLTNTSKQTIAFLDLNEHNLLFINKKNGFKFIPFHTCSCIRFIRTKNRFISLSPGESRKQTFNGWSCDGSIFGVPEAGIYKISYRTLIQKNISSNTKYRELIYSKGSIQFLNSKCKEIFNSDKFWKGAIYSNTILAKIKNQK